MKFVIADQSAKEVALEQAGDDVIVRVDALAVMALRGANGVLAVSQASVTEAGLTVVME